MPSMKSIQGKLARTALGLGIREVSVETGLGGTTINRFEKGGDARVSTVDLLQDFYEARGIQFIDADEVGGPGIRVNN